MATLLIRGAPLLALCLQTALYGQWIVDDAAITFSYARAAAAGQGFVTWPGATPVEGFSNPAWLLLQLPFLWAGLFDPVWTPKLLGLILAGAALVGLRPLVVRSLGAGRPAWLADLALTLAAANPAVVIWCCAGLENPLYLAAVVGLVTHAARPVGIRTHDIPVAAGWALLAATTRPDGLVFAAVWPATQLLGTSSPLRQRLVSATSSSMLVVAGLALLTWWRWETFGDLLPNTARVKLGAADPVQQLGALATAASIAAGLAIARRPLAASRSSAGPRIALVALLPTTLIALGLPSTLRSALRDLAAPGLGLAVTALALERLTSHRPGGLRDVTAAPAVALGCALLGVGLLPPDWMGEQRFATPLLVLATAFGFPAAVEAGRGLVERATVHAPRASRLAVALVLAAALGITGFRHTRRALDIAAAPTVPMQAVQDRFEATFGAWSEDLDVEDPTVLLPDVGGALWSGTLPVLDLGGLCHAEIARLLARGDRRALADLILDELQPAFLGMHGHWAWWSGLPDDPRFARDYLPVWTAPDARLSTLAGRTLDSGHYVRRTLDPGAATRSRWRAEALQRLRLDD